MAIMFLAILSFVLVVLAGFLYQAFRRAVHDQVKLANLLMEGLTSDTERARHRTEFLDFVLKSRYPDASTLAGMSVTFLVSLARKRAPHTALANRDIYWAMNQAPGIFFENGDTSKPVRAPHR